jgi:hypothetical protein
MDSEINAILEKILSQSRFCDVLVIASATDGASHQGPLHALVFQYSKDDVGVTNLNGITILSIGSVHNG